MCSVMIWWKEGKMVKDIALVSLSLVVAYHWYMKKEAVRILKAYNDKSIGTGDVRRAIKFFGVYLR